MLFTNLLISVCSFSEIIYCFIYFFQSKFLVLVFFRHIFSLAWLYIPLVRNILFILVINYTKNLTVSVDSSSWNLFPSLLPDLSQTIERTNVLSRMHYILKSLIFLYLLHLMQEVFFIFTFLESKHKKKFMFQVIENILALIFFFFFYSFGKKNATF